MLRKKIVPIALAGCLLSTYLPSNAYAAFIEKDTEAAIAIEAGKEVTGAANSTEASKAETYLSTEPTADDLTALITLIKGKITIPKELSVFDYSFNSESSYQKATWHLSWRNEEYSKRIMVECDVLGNILNYRTYDDNYKRYNPQYLKSELREQADQFINQAAPNIKGSIEYIGTEVGGSYNGEYSYLYQRVVNGIPMPDNIVSVGVNYETGKVITYNSNWIYDVEIPSSDVKITKKEAADKIGKSVTMKLEYRSGYTTDDAGNGVVNAYLVYYPDESYVAVDAKTGEVYTTQNEWINGFNDSTKEESADTASTAKDAGGLTDEEIKKVEELKGLITKDKAIHVITENKSLLLDKNLKSITAKLYKYNQNNTSDKDQYVWNIYLSDPRERNYETGDIYRAYANAAVDAKTGKILSFNANVEDYNDLSNDRVNAIKVKYDEKESQKRFESFLKEQIPDLFKNSVLSDNEGSYIIAYKEDKEIYGGYYYNYDRVNEGIPYSSNGINGAVDGVTGKIYSFSYNWDDNVIFEAPNNILSADQAFDAYIDNDGFQLVYEINSIHNLKDVVKIDYESYDYSSNDYSVTDEVRLVYRTDINPYFISPFTGKQLDYNGDEYNKEEKDYTYNDINELKSARNIKLLADIGVGYEGGRFNPSKEITKKELAKFLHAIGYYFNEDELGFVESSYSISRIEAAKLMIQILGYDNIAKLDGIYKLDFVDKDKLSESYRGYAALALGFNLIDTNDNNEFRPFEKLTRLEAADLLMAMMSVEE